MRDAFGGAFMIKLFLVFILIYVGFTAVALNYAKAFKVKNAMVKYLESNEIAEISSESAVFKDKLEEYITKEIHGNMNYYGNINCGGSDELGITKEYCKNGIRIDKYDPVVTGETNKLGVYHKVTVAIAWNLPFMNGLLRISGRDDNIIYGTWYVSGETRPIVKE